MISGDNPISILDIGIYSPDNTGKFEKLFVNQLFQKYSFNMEKYSSIDLNSYEVHIRSLNGWTRLLRINKFNLIKNNMFKVIYNDSSIILSGDEFIPIWNPDISSIGFHGEVKYKYTLVQLDKIVETLNSNQYFIRLKNGEFTDKFLIEKSDILYDYAYEIQTSSRFYNCGDFYLFGYDKIRLFKNIEIW